MVDVEVYGKMLSTLPEDDDHPYRSGPWRPQSIEYDATDLDVTGELPDDLYGVYLRNTENPLHPAIVRYHPFDGDAMIHKVSFRDGKVSYRNRFVRTDGLLAEQQAGRSLWAGIAENPDVSTRPDGWGARGRMKDAASTDVVVHAGVAVASFWQCGDLYRLDPLTLDDLGKCSWGGSFPAELGVSAHTKVDDHTGELLFFNYGTTAPYLHYGVVDAGNRLVHYVPIELPGPRLPHDMAYTEHYAILNDMPLFWEPELLARGRYASRFHPDIPSRLGVIPRRGASADIRWFEFDPTYVVEVTGGFVNNSIINNNINLSGKDSTGVVLNGADYGTQITGNIFVGGSGTSPFGTPGAILLTATIGSAPSGSGAFPLPSGWTALPNLGTVVRNNTIKDSLGGSLPAPCTG